MTTVLLNHYSSLLRSLFRFEVHIPSKVKLDKAVSIIEYNEAKFTTTVNPTAEVVTKFV